MESLPCVLSYSITSSAEQDGRGYLNAERLNGGDCCQPLSRRAWPPRKTERIARLNTTGDCRAARFWPG